MIYNSVYHCDCLELMKSLPKDKIDLIIADPPYFKIKGEFDFIWNSVEEYIEWCQEWIIECNRILKETGSFYIWGKIGYNKGFALFKLADWIEKNRLFIIKNWITQRNTRGRGTKIGYMEAREELLFMTKTDKYTWNTAYTEEKSTRKDLGFNGKPRKNENKRCSDVWIDIAEASQSSNQQFETNDGKNFPTVKALKLCDRIIKASSNENDIIFIPFAGSGSEIISCLNNKRYFIAAEKDLRYINEIIIPRFRETLHIIE